MARLSHNQRTWLYFAVVAAGFLATGCQDVDWDWESRWWQKSSREVKPDRRVARDGRTTPPPAAPAPKQPDAPQPVAVSTPPADAATHASVQSAPPASSTPPPSGKTETLEVQAEEQVELTTSSPPAPAPQVSSPPPATPAPTRTEPRPSVSIAPSEPVATKPPPATPPPAPPRPAEEQIASARTSERLSLPDRSSSATPSPTPSPRSVRASPPSEPVISSGPDVFYQLYLLSEPSTQRAAPNTQRLKLANAPSRAAAQVISQLYQPVGQAGSERQTYLIYQDLDEWRAAQAAVPWVDVPSGASSGIGRGVRSLLEVAGAGPMPDRESVNAAHAALSQVVSDSSADSRVRWAAAMWDGKLTSEQLFDDTAAAASFDTAIKLAPPGSVERLSALLARAESYQAVGDRDSAKRAYAALADEFGASHPRSQAVQRAKTLRSSGGR